MAENNIGWLYENGFGVAQDYTEALNWFRKAATGGYDEAQNNIGWLYQNGWGAKQDYSEAMTWYRKAAEQGNARACMNLGFLYDGGLGVKQDYSEAATWYQTAAQHGNVKAQVHLGLLYQKGLGGADGNPRDIKVVRSLGKGLDEKAVDAINTWKFEPGTKDGVPIATQIEITVEFHMK